MMVITRTPLRISFAGCGSDLESYYRYFPGAVVSTTINKYIYITVNSKFDGKIKASYSKIEIVKKPQDLKHELIREALLMLEIDGGIEITSISDIPSTGTGLGSSSSYTVGLLKALHAYKSEFVSNQQLAEEACDIEINRCHRPIGKQDQYIATFGNLNSIQFLCNGDVLIDTITCKTETKKKLEENLLMLYTNISRQASPILARQDREMACPAKRKIVSEMVEIAKRLRLSIESNNLETFGNLLHQNWELKKQITEEISNSRIDEWYETARKNGALGGKVCGAGGGGFLLLYAPKEKHEAICSVLPKLRYTKFSFEEKGSEIVYSG